MEEGGGRTYLNQELGTLDVGDEGHGEVDGHAAGAVALRHEGGDPPRSATTHRKVDHQVELLEQKTPTSYSLITEVCASLSMLTLCIH